MLRSLLIVVAMTAGCGMGPPTVTAGDASRSGFELVELQHGRELLVKKCSGCHRTPTPSQHLAGDWPGKLDEMAERSHLDVDQRRAIQDYLVAMAH
jgi:hypothetical protein